MKAMLQRLLADDGARATHHGEDAAAFAAHRRIILGKPLLADAYRRFYAEFARAAQALPPGPRIELGAGGGFLKSCVPGVRTSDVVTGAELDLVCAGEALPFADESVSGVFLLHVLHHMARPVRFLAEAERCLRPGGRLVMVEPASTWWGRLVRRAMHHEAYDGAGGWELDAGAHSNLALPWILFDRDRADVARAFPRLRLVRYEPHTPLRLLLSGGVTYRALVPGAWLPLVRLAERAASPLNGMFGMHVTIELLKTERAA